MELDNRPWWGGGKGAWKALVVPIQERGTQRSPSRSRDRKKRGSGGPARRAREEGGKGEVGEWLSCTMRRRREGAGASVLEGRGHDGGGDLSGGT
jgi:hypothetical protein